MKRFEVIFDVLFSHPPMSPDLAPADESRDELSCRRCHYARGVPIACRNQRSAARPFRLCGSFARLVPDATGVMDNYWYPRAVRRAPPHSHDARALVAPAIAHADNGTVCC
jgi:hypothetical protein